MNLSVVAICFPLVFLGELPDKTMFANLIMATKGRPAQVWLGAAAAFTVHVAIAITIGVALFKVVPHRALEFVVAALFAAGATYAWWEGRGSNEVEQQSEEVALVNQETARHRTLISAFVVIFLAEWGDLTQVLTADLAARYHSALSVGTGALFALWAVAGLAVTAGQTLTRYVKPAVVRKVTTVVLLVLAGVTLYSAVR